MRAKLIFILALTAFLWQNCAKQTAPTGGPKDEIPPVIERSNPAHKAINFKGKDLVVTLDELIQLNNPREQILITPGIGKKFEVGAKKNKVTLTFNAELEPNTTYTINFRDAVQDLTEKNPAKLKLAFSTGSYIDSLSVTGKVYDILSDKPGKNYTVAIAPASDTFNIFKHGASWISITDKQGRFSLENLKPGSYLLYAFDDKNKNLIVDSKSEKYGFRKELIDLNGKIDSVKILTYKQDANNLRLISSRTMFAYYNIRLSKSVTQYTLTSTTPSETVLSGLEKDLTTIRVYNTIPDLDSLQVRLQAEDSIASKIDTLLYIKFPKKESTKEKFVYKVEHANVYEAKSTFSSTVTFNKPVVQFSPDSMYIQADSVNRITFTQGDYQWNENFTKLTFNKKVGLKSAPIEALPQQKKPGEKTPSLQSKLILAKASAISVENDTMPLISTVIKFMKPEENGTILIKIETKESYILQLIDKNGKLIEETKNKNNHTFENIPPGTYSLRLLIDKNKNGKWDPGNFSKKEEAEPVIYYVGPKGGKDIFLKANWQVGPLLITH